MMLIVVLDASVYRAWSIEKPKWAWAGLLLDLSLITAAFLGAFGYLVEIDSVCLIDQITGERERLIADAAARSEGVIPGMSFDAELPSRRPLPSLHLLSRPSLGRSRCEQGFPPCVWVL